MEMGFRVKLPTQLEHAVMLTYGRLVPLSDAAMAPLEQYLTGGAELERGFAREELATGRISFVLGNVRVDDEVRILSGRIGQVERRPVATMRFDEHHQAFVPDEVVEEETVTAAFAVHLDEGWVLMEDLAQDLPPMALLEALSGLVNQEIEQPARHIHGLLVERDEDPFSFMARVDLVTRVEVGLRPSNPGGETWREYDELLERARAKRLRIRFESEEGLAVPEEGADPTDNGNPVAAAVEMAEAGYSTADGVQIVAEFNSASATYDTNTRSARLNDELPSEELDEFDDPDPVLRALTRRLSRAVTRGLFQRWHSSWGL